MAFLVVEVNVHKELREEKKAIILNYPEVIRIGNLEVAV
jgi:hypothetical protein